MIFYIQCREYSNAERSELDISIFIEEETGSEKLSDFICLNIKKNG